MDKLFVISVSSSKVTNKGIVEMSNTVTKLLYEICGSRDEAVGRVYSIFSRTHSVIDGWLPPQILVLEVEDPRISIDGKPTQETIKEGD